MIRQILHQLDTMKQSSQTSWRRLCDPVPYASVMRWRQRQKQGLPVWQCPGPKKSLPLDWSEFYPLLRQLNHGRVRSQGTGEPRSKPMTACGRSSSSNDASRNLPSAAGAGKKTKSRKPARIKPTTKT